MSIKAGKVLSFSRDSQRISFKTETGTLCLSFYRDTSLFVQFYTRSPLKNRALQAELISLPDNLTITEENQTYLIRSTALEIRVDKNSSALAVKYGDRSLKLLDYTLNPLPEEGEDIFESTAVLSAEENESFYGLGQQQTHTLDYAGHRVEVYHNYKGEGGERIGIPFLVSSRRYGIFWNNISQSVIEPGVDGKSLFTADATRDMSLIIMMGRTFDDIYFQYRHITGTTPIPLKAALGYIQCKQRYKNQKEVLEIARKYREKGYPCDMMVVDWFYWRVLGDMEMNPEYWPDPAAMNRELKEMGFDTMISVWPRFMKESLCYRELEERGWFAADRDGQTVYGSEDDRRGALIDTTDEECSQWYWRKIRDNLASKGFNAWWLDENEPDLWPYDFQFAAGSGRENFNLYPYTHCQGVYEGHRRTLPERCTILSRSAYPGAQQFGTQFWSSDIYPTWDALRRQIPAAVNFCASGFAWWSSDIGGWQALPDYHDDNSDNSLLLDTRNSGLGIVDSKTFYELYIRWFQFSVFCPVFRAHGTRAENEVWSYGAEAEEILVKFLNLRYSLMPYIYSLAYKVYRDGAPLLRGMFLDFDDEALRDCKDQFMFGPSLLVAPVLEEGARQRSVYLPAGCKWYDFHSGTPYEGGQTITAKAPLDVIPLFVREGSVLPLGNPVQSTKERQNEITLNVYTGRDAVFSLYSDDGRTYDYEKGEYSLYELKWMEEEKKLVLPEAEELLFFTNYYK